MGYFWDETVLMSREGKDYLVQVTVDGQLFVTTGYFDDLTETFVRQPEDRVQRVRMEGREMHEVYYAPKRQWREDFLLRLLREKGLVDA